MEIINDYDTMCKCFQEKSEWGIVFTEQQYVFFTKGSEEENNHFGSNRRILELISPGNFGVNSPKLNKVGTIAFDGSGYISLFLPSLNKISSAQIEFLSFILKTMIKCIDPGPDREHIVCVPYTNVESLAEILTEIEKIEPKDDNIDVTENIVGIPFTDLQATLKNKRN